MRSSNSPRNLVPAIKLPMFREYMRKSFKQSGTFPENRRSATAFPRAVFPTPASPISNRLFFILRHKIWNIRSNSFSRPIMGSSDGFNS